MVADTQWGWIMGLRIWTLIAIDVFFCLGLLTLVFLGGSEYLWSIVTCIALIAYVSWSIAKLMRMAKQPSNSPQ
jgi:hypothetical protein